MRQAQRHYSVKEYLSLDEGSNLRLEYLDGEIFAMSGGTRNHNRIAQNLTRFFDPLLRHGCSAYINDVRLGTPAGLFTYPDVMLVCSAAHDNSETVTNPVFIGEVLSVSTRDYDRGQKFELYRTIPTLRDYVLVDQYAIDVEHRFLSEGRWESRRYNARADAFALNGVEVTLHVDALYDLVDFSASPDHQ